MRSAKTHREGKIEAVMVKETFVPKFIPMQRFRRSIFAVLKIRKHGKIYDGSKLEKISVEIVDEQAIALNVDQGDEQRAVPPEPAHIRTPSLSHQAAIDALFHTKDEFEVLTASEDPNTGGEELERSSSPIMRSPPGIKSLTNDGRDSENTTPQEDVLKTDVASVDAPTSGYGTEDNTITSIPTIRPSPGLHFPVYSLEGFYRLLELPAKQTLKEEPDEDHNRATIDNAAGEIVEIVTHDGSGSTVSNHEHDDAFLVQ